MIEKFNVGVYFKQNTEQKPTHPKKSRKRSRKRFFPNQNIHHLFKSSFNFTENGAVSSAKNLILSMQSDSIKVQEQ